MANFDVKSLAIKNDIDEYEDLAGNPAFDPYLNDKNT